MLKASCSSSSMAASTVQENADLLTEILVCLPVKTVIRFKCVSKQWLSHISDPCFTRSYTLRRYTPFPSHLLDTKNPTNFFLAMPSTSSSYRRRHVPSTPKITDFKFLDVPPEFQFLLTGNLVITQSCNGLVLVKGNDSSVQRIYFVCNPITKQFRAFFLPPEDHDFYLCDDFQVHLAFDPLRSSHYKVIYILYKSRVSDDLDPENNTDYKFDVHVFSSETKYWTNLGVCHRAGEGMLSYPGVYCNDAIYWRSERKNSLYFDVENQCFKRFPMPRDGQFEKDDFLYFGESAGHLHMIVQQTVGEGILASWNTVFDIFELEADSCGWSVRFHVDFGGLVMRPICVLSVFCQEKEEDSVLVFCKHEEVIFYNLSDYTFKRVVDFDRSLSSFVHPRLLYSGKVLQYSESLSWDGDTSALGGRSYDQRATESLFKRRQEGRKRKYHSFSRHGCLYEG